MGECKVDCEHEWFISGIVRCTKGETILDTGEAEARLNEAEKESEEASDSLLTGEKDE